MSCFKTLAIGTIMMLSAVGQSYAQKPGAAKKSIIHTRTVLLTYKHNDSSYLQDHNDTLFLPEPSGKYPGLKKALSFKNIADADGEAAVKKNYAECSCGITGLNYEVTFESGDILSIKIFTEGMGAYPSSSWQWLTLNIPTGKPYNISNEINGAGLKWIYNNYRTLLWRRIARDRKTNPAPAGENQEDYNSIYDEQQQSVNHLSMNDLFKNFVFTDKGIAVTTAGVLPHATQALEIDREWLIPYDRLIKYKANNARVVK